MGTWDEFFPLKPDPKLAIQNASWFNWEISQGFWSVKQDVCPQGFRNQISTRTCLEWIHLVYQIDPLNQNFHSFTILYECLNTL